MPRVIAIARTDRPDRVHWIPLQTTRGYQLVDRKIPYPERNLTTHATFVASLDEAGDLVDAGYAIRMSEPGSSYGDYIYPENIKITRV